MKITKHPANPVLDVAGSDIESVAVYEPWVMNINGCYTMWYGGRGKGRDEICVAFSIDGINWRRHEGNPVLTTGDEPSGWAYSKITRPSVVIVDGIYHMWYSSVEPPPDTGKPPLDRQAARIGHASSSDGIHWNKCAANPVLSPTESWELLSLQCPNVLYEDCRYKMWFCGGRRYETDAVGYAESVDGIAWTKHPGNPLFHAQGGWEGHKIGPLTVVRADNWYYAFYNAYDDADKGDGCGYSRIGIARSRDGIGGWERHPQNPLIDLSPGGFDGHSAYKASPMLIQEDGQTYWRIWYNGAQERTRKESIGLAYTDCLW